MTERDIEKNCHLGRRFSISLSRTVKKYSDGRFVNALKEGLLEIIKVCENPNNYPQRKSEAYLRSFMEDNPTLNLRGFNPFYIANFNKSLSIDIIYILIDECQSAGICDLLIKGKLSDTQKVCAYDLFQE